MGKIFTVDEVRWVTEKHTVEKPLKAFRTEFEAKCFISDLGALFACGNSGYLKHDYKTNEDVLYRIHKYDFDEDRPS